MMSRWAADRAKKTNAEKTGKMSLRPLFLILFILSVLSGLAVCVWLELTYDIRDIYYAWLILIVYSITGATLIFLR